MMLLPVQKLRPPLCSMIRRPFVLGWVVFLLSACNNKKEVAVNYFSDTTLIKIADYQDGRLTDSLYAMVKGENPVVDKNALLAFGSVQDTSARKYLESVLDLPDHNLSEAAAFALGQMTNGAAKFLQGSHAHAAATPKEYLYLGKYWIQEGIYPHDSMHMETVPWAFYRYGLNNKVGETHALKVNHFLTSNSLYSRLGAVHFFGRSNALDSISSTAKAIIQGNLMRVAQFDSAEVRMAAALSLRKINNDSTFKLLVNLARTDKDYRVRVNAIRALQRFPFEQTKESFKQALTDRNVNVGIAASEIILSSITKDDWKEFSTFARTALNWRVQANLYEAALKASDSKELAEEIARAARAAVNPYQKAGLISALQQSLMSFGFIEEQLMEADIPVVKTAAASALVALNYRENFEPALRKRFADIYVQAVLQGDPGVIGTVANALADSTLMYRSVITDFSFLKIARNKMSFPKDAESMQSLDAAIAYFEKKELRSIKTEFNHPIDWALVKNIPRDQQVLISTTKGNIIIRLFVEETPGTVANFVRLVKDGYFNNKFFHRVVPNFVVQAGCPRGDGWGSEDYSIRSEFTPRRFITGSVGMASSGKDTEGTQWFITHSPTPHLEGRYTNFAEVVSGMDVVHQLEVGDRILEMRLK
jgi:cyclophilin family peptidyl-prolyl cis-trans isomerase/HEAT repeat protein